MSCKKAGTWARPYGDVANSVAGFVDCGQQCKAGGYTYFGLECPRATVHCQCANALSGSTAQASTECDRKNIAGSTHCSGPYMAGAYMLGGHGTGSVYLTAATTVMAGVATYSSGCTIATCSAGYSFSASACTGA